MEGIDNGELVRRLLQIPILRELNSLLRSATRPVDWKLAEQISDAVASSATRSHKASPADVDELQTDCRIAELAVVGNSGLGPVQGISHVQLLGRAQWAQLNLDTLKPLTERLASRLSSGGGLAQAVPVRSLIEAVGPLLMGAQFGMVFGYLSHKALGLWDLCLPRSQSGRLYFNFSNIVEVERELDVDPKQFRMWLAVHEVSSELHFQAVQWTRPYLQGLIEQYVDAAELDSSELASKLRNISDPEELGSILQRPEDLLPMLRTPAQAVIAEKIECFLGLNEAYTGLVTRRACMALVEQFDKIREGISRRSAERSSPERMLEKLFGVDLSLRTLRTSERFVAALEEAGLLGVLWQKPQNLPSIEELAQPERWISRVGVA